MSAGAKLKDPERAVKSAVPAEPVAVAKFTLCVSAVAPDLVTVKVTTPPSVAEAFEIVKLGAALVLVIVPFACDGLPRIAPEDGVES